MMTLIMALVVAAPLEPLPAPVFQPMLPAPVFQPMLPAPVFVDVQPTVVIHQHPAIIHQAPSVVYRLGSLGPNWTPPDPQAYNPLPVYQPAPAYQQQAYQPAPVYQQSFRPAPAQAAVFCSPRG